MVYGRVMLYICYINTIPNWRFILGFPTSTITVTVTQTRHVTGMHWATGQALPTSLCEARRQLLGAPGIAGGSLARWTTSGSA